MYLKRTIIVMLSLFMCLCVLSKQANASYGMDFDIPTYVDMPQVEAYGDHDSNEPTTLVVPYSLPQVMASVQLIISDDTYRQPAQNPLLRPPAI
ncbi:MAG: hypothetical protein ACXW1P_04660 [Methylophilaceae bacterium]